MVSIIIGLLCISAVVLLIFGSNTIESPENLRDSKAVSFEPVRASTLAYWESHYGLDPKNHEHEILNRADIKRR